MARTYTPRQISIIRSKQAAKNAAAQRTAPATHKPSRFGDSGRGWKARTPKTRAPFVRPEPKHVEFGRTVTFMIVSDQEYGNPVEHRFTGTAEMARTLDLDCVAGLTSEIAEYERDGRVFACIDPYGVELYKERALLLASDAEQLETRFCRASDDV